MASCETSVSSSDKRDEKPPFTAADLSDGDDFSDISDSELVTVQDEAMRDYRASACFLETAVQPVEGSDLQLKSCEGLGTREKVFQRNRGENSKNKQHSAETSQRKRKQQEQPQTPMEKYKMKYLWVTNLCSQTWCEQQMVYEFELPEFIEPEKSEAMNTGSSIHLARELEVHDLVTVATKSREDSWAIKFINVLSMIPILQSGGCIREFPVFGELDGVLLVGVIDELGYSPKGELELRELKTRRTPTMPTSAQKRSNQFQVSLYKLLFDSMVSGGLQPDIFIQHLHLNPEQTLGPEVKEHASKMGLIAFNFKDLLELTCLNLTYSDLPMIEGLKIEYCYQENSSLLGCEVVCFNKAMVLEQLTFQMAFWKGLRETQGVDIEEAWKCRKCTFSNICEWRTRELYFTKGKRSK